MQAGLTDVERSSAGAAMTQNIDAWAIEKTARTLLEKRATESIIEAARPRPVSAQTRGDNLAPEWVCPVQPWGPSSSWMRRAIAAIFRSIASK